MAVVTTLRMTRVWKVAHLPWYPTAALTVVSDFVSTRMLSVQVLYHTVVAYQADLLVLFKSDHCAK